MKNADRGQIRIIEAFLAVLVIFSAFAVSANLPTPRATIKRERLASIGLHVLMKLDEDGSLSKHIINQNFTALRESLDLVLPVGVCFNLTVYDEQMRQINTDVISNGEFSSQDVVLAEYVCASQNATFHFYVIRLFLAVTT